MPRPLLVSNTFFVYTVPIRPTGWSLSSRGSPAAFPVGSLCYPLLWDPPHTSLSWCPCGFGGHLSLRRANFCICGLYKYRLLSARSSSSTLPPLPLALFFFSSSVTSRVDRTGVWHVSVTSWATSWHHLVPVKPCLGEGLPRTLRCPLLPPPSRTGTASRYIVPSLPPTMKAMTTVDE